MADQTQNQQQTQAKMGLPEFAQTIKQTYPEYQHVDDQQLVNEVLAKFPEYRNRVDLSPGQFKQQAQPIDQNYGFTWGNIGRNLWEGLKSVPEGVYALGSDIVSNPNWVTGPSSTLQKFVFAPADVQAQQAKDLWRQGRYSEAIGHGLAAGIPVIGPAAAQIGEQVGTGDIGGGLSRGAGQLLGAEALSLGTKAATRGTAAGARGIGERVTPKQAAQAVGGIGGALEGRGLLSIPGAYYGARGLGKIAENVLGAERANRPILTPRPKVEIIPPAGPIYPAPGTIPPLLVRPRGFAGTPAEPIPPRTGLMLPGEVPQSAALAQGPVTVPRPQAAALGEIPQPRMPVRPFYPQAGDIRIPPYQPRPAAYSPFGPAQPIPSRTGLALPAAPEGVIPRAPEVTPEEASSLEQFGRVGLGRELPTAVSGEGAATTVLSNLSFPQLIDIARARGLEVADEVAQGTHRGAGAIVRKIVNSMNNTELANMRSNYIEWTRGQRLITQPLGRSKAPAGLGVHEFGAPVTKQDIQTMQMQQYFPEVAQPLERIQQMQKNVAAARGRAKSQ